MKGFIEKYYPRFKTITLELLKQWELEAKVVSKPTFNADGEVGPELIPPFNHLKTLSKIELNNLNNEL